MAEEIKVEETKVEETKVEAPAEDKAEVEKMVGKIFGKTASEVEEKVSAKMEAKVKGMKEDLEAFVKKATATKGSKSVFALSDENVASLKAMANGKKGETTVELKGFDLSKVKTAGDISVDGNITGELPQAQLDTTVSRDPQRSPFIQELVSVGTINSNLDAWIETTNEDGDPAPVAELAKLPAKDWDFARRTAEVKKIGVYTKYSKEMGDDLPNLVNEVKNFLVTDLKRVVDSQILNGDGEYDNLTGILKNAVAYSAGSFAGTIPNANEFDVIETAVAQVVTALHTPSVVCVNPVDLSKMRLSKDDNGAYVLPPFITANGTTVSGLRVVANTGITADKFLVGDFSKSSLKYKQGLTLEMTNTDQDDFVKDRFTVKATVRLVQRVRENDYEAFVYGDFSDAIAAINKAS